VEQGLPAAEVADPAVGRTQRHQDPVVAAARGSERPQAHVAVRSDRRDDFGEGQPRQLALGPRSAREPSRHRAGRVHGDQNPAAPPQGAPPPDHATDLCVTRAGPARQSARGQGPRGAVAGSQVPVQVAVAVPSQHRLTGRGRAGPSAARAPQRAPRPAPGPCRRRRPRRGSPLRTAVAPRRTLRAVRSPAGRCCAGPPSRSVVVTAPSCPATTWSRTCPAPGTRTRRAKSAIAVPLAEVGAAAPTSSTVASAAASVVGLVTATGPTAPPSSAAIGGPVRPATARKQLCWPSGQRPPASEPLSSPHRAGAWLPSRYAGPGPATAGCQAPHVRQTAAKALTGAPRDLGCDLGRGPLGNREAHARERGGDRVGDQPGHGTGDGPGRRRP
jgi:hypothetical protein